ncbi:DUF4097 family beta strand repeat-containing protein [Halosimplex salinum]|uniref:DUF4097 family beta strand repeat-containing protein n=1 Tax=Halosimplex salinum TaxID=1710538 RepID=UPI000F4A02B2|nr:DUF4097 family beta strand repeat-containing protein [Halosimplex salinum]
MRVNEATADRSRAETQSGTTRRTALKGLGVAATALLAGCSVTADVERETADVEYSVDGSEVDRIAVSGDDGDTTVRGWDGDDVRVEATKYARGRTDLSDVTVTRAVADGRLDIEADVSVAVGIGPAGGGLESLDVRVPQGTRVTRVEMDDGDAEVTDVAGDLTLDVDDGTVEVGPLSGHLETTVDDGTVTVGAVDRVTGEFDDGALEMTEPATVGDLSVDDGDLELAIEDLDGDATVECDDGTVTARVAPTIDATVVVNADDGSVQYEGDLFDSVSTNEDTTRGEIGDGGDRLTIDVDDGDVRMSPL